MNLLTISRERLGKPPVHKTITDAEFLIGQLGYKLFGELDFIAIVEPNRCYKVIKAKDPELAGREVPEADWVQMVVEHYES